MLWRNFPGKAGEPEQMCMVSREKRHASKLCQNSQASVADVGGETG